MTNPDNEAVVLRFYEQMNNERKVELAPELFTADHKLHDPQVPAGDGPEAMAAAVSVMQNGIDAHWTINEIFSGGDRVVVRWTGSGTHIGEVNGIPPTGRPVGPVECNVIHRMAAARSPRRGGSGTPWASCSKSAFSQRGSRATDPMTPGTRCLCSTQGS